MSTPNYTLTGDDSIVTQLNPLLQSIADRISKLEGYKGKPSLLDYGTDEGGANDYIINPDPPWRADEIVEGTRFRFIANAANTGASTFTVSDNVYTITDQNGAALASGAISAGQLVTLFYDGTYMQYGADDSGLTSPVGATDGGTGLTSATQGDILYASGANTWAKLAKDTNSTRVLTNTGTNNNPAWAQVALTTGVSGVLPTANGGTSVNIASAALPLGSGQIQFPATQSASSDANTLDDYEEGTWTPTLQDTSLSDSESQAYTTQAGYYQKIGKIVHIYGQLVTSSTGTLTGGNTARISGLPFTSAAADGTRVGISGITATGLAQGAASMVTAVIDASGTSMQLWNFDTTAGGSTLTVTEWSADGGLRFWGIYEATS